MFIQKTPTAIVDDPTKPADAQNILFIRPDLTLDQFDAYWAEYDRRARQCEGVLSPAQEEVLIFKHRLCGWQGPAYAGAEFTPENINRLDYEDPLVTRAIIAAAQAHYGIPDDPPEPGPKASASATPSTTSGSAAG